MAHARTPDRRRRALFLCDFNNALFNTVRKPSHCATFASCAKIE